MMGWKTMRMWIENGVIRCASQLCEIGGQPCPRIRTCRAYEVVRLDSLPGFFLVEADKHAKEKSKRST